MNISSVLEFTQQVNRAYSACCEPVCQKFRISRTSFDILLFLANNPELYTARDVVRYRSLKPNVVSCHVEQLVSDGYLTRNPVPEDRRRIRLQYTDKALPLIQAGQSMQRAFHAHLIRGLKREELDTFQHCFRIITENAADFRPARQSEGGTSQC